MEKELALIISSLISNINGSKEEQESMGQKVSESILIFEEEYPSLTDKEKEEIKVVSKVLKKTYGGNNEIYNK